MVSLLMVSVSVLMVPQLQADHFVSRVPVLETSHVPVLEKLHIPVLETSHVPVLGASHVPVVEGSPTG